MHNLHTIDHISVREQREKIFKNNPDRVYGVYRKIQNKNNEIYLELTTDIITCHTHEFDDLYISDDCSDMNIVDLEELQTGNINVLHGNNNIHNPEELLLVSNGVLEYIEGSSGKKHMISTLNSNNNQIDSEKRNLGAHLTHEVEREHYEEGAFLGKNKNGQYCLAIPEGNPNGWNYTKESISYWLEQVYNLDSSDEKNKDFIDSIEKNLPGVSYSEIPEILGNIMWSDRYITYSWEKSEIPGLKEGMKHIHMTNEGENSIYAYTTFSPEKNTLLYQVIRKIRKIPEDFQLLGNKPSKLYLKDISKYTRIPRVENASIPSCGSTVGEVSQKTETVLSQE
ncbi:MAG: hypothetical protein GY828_06460 [Candidatus Gracilibacteria bacterium]|nr:hypothetical protein [Candidatus Gracilibacteria bacterium]